MWVKLLEGRLAGEFAFLRNDIARALIAAGRAEKVDGRPLSERYIETAPPEVIPETPPAPAERPEPAPSVPGKRRKG